MSLEIKCSGCQRLLRIPESAAGKKVKCPGCQEIIEAPAAADAAAEEAADAESWTLQLEDGRRYGPVDRGELDRWVAEGRVTPGTRLNRQGSDQWQSAAEIYPQLAQMAAAAGVAAGASPWASPTYPTAMPRRGSVWAPQILVVSILLIVQGALEIMIGALFLVVGIAAAADEPGAPFPVFLVMGGAPFVAGLLKIAAGIQNCRHRWRTLGFVAFGSGILSFCSVYCAPTAVALGVYGLIVYLQPDAARAFELARQGHSRHEILDEFR